MTIDSLIAELNKLPSNYEVVFSGHKDVPEREIQVIISYKEEFVIIKYRSYLEEIQEKIQKARQDKII